MHDLDVECGCSYFRIPEFLSNWTVLPKTDVLPFYHLASVDSAATLL